jgi:hypothetical protein
MFIFMLSGVMFLLMNFPPEEWRLHLVYIFVGDLFNPFASSGGGHLQEAAAVAAGAVAGYLSGMTEASRAAKVLQGLAHTLI